MYYVTLIKLNKKKTFASYVPRIYNKWPIFANKKEPIGGGLLGASILIVSFFIYACEGVKYEKN